MNLHSRTTAPSEVDLPRDARTATLLAAIRARLEGFTERQRAREAMRLPLKAYMRAYSTVLRAAARREKSRLAAAAPPPHHGPLLPRFPARQVPAIYIDPPKASDYRTLSC